MNSVGENFVFWPDWLTAVVAVVALLQVWAIALWKWSRRGRLEIHEARVIEIGYSEFGPTIGLLGTLRSVHREAFVTKMTVTVTRRVNSAQLSLDWRARRSTSFLSGVGEQTRAEVAYSFLVPANGSHPYDILFASEEFETRHLAPFQSWLREWWAYVDENLPKGESDGMRMVSEPEQGQLEQWYRDFTRKLVSTELYARLDRDFFWIEGEYELHLLIECVGKDAPTSKRWQFALSDEDAAELRLNVFALMENACQLKRRYHRVFRRYTSPATG